jgi:hypothetical protein
MMTSDKSNISDILKETLIASRVYHIDKPEDEGGLFCHCYRLKRKPGKETWPDIAGWMLFTAAFEANQIAILSQHRRKSDHLVWDLRESVEFLEALSLSAFS